MDTTTRMGLFCSKGTSQSAVNTMCMMMGHKKGVKLPPVLFGNPSFPQEPFFVFEAVNCLGGEESIFDCDLAPWGVEGCEGGDILTILCGEEGVEGISIIGEEENGYSVTKKLLGFGNEEALITPSIQIGSQQLGFCAGNSFSPNEANVLCQLLGYGCGVANYTEIVGNTKYTQAGEDNMVITQ